MPAVFISKLIGAAWLALAVAPPLAARPARAAATFHVQGGGDTRSSCEALAARLGPAARVDATEHFYVVHAQDELWAGGMTRLLEQGHDLFYSTFGEAGFELAPLSRPLLWIYFDTHEQFDAYTRELDGMDLSWLDAYYSSRSNRVALVSAPHRREPVETQLVRVATSPEIRPFDDPAFAVDVARVTHELAHQLAFNSGLLARGVMIPFWISEGLATSFESDTAASCGGEQPNLLRLSRLLRARAARGLAPLEEFLTAVAVPADDPARANRMYDQGWAVFRFMLRHHREALRGYLDELRRLAPGARSPATLRREIVAAFGPVDALQAQWEAFVEALAAPVADQTTTARPEPTRDAP